MPPNARASWRSLRPLPYVSAASKKVMPRSYASRSSVTASSSLFLPHQSVAMVQRPNPISETEMLVEGKILWCMVVGRWSLAQALGGVHGEVRDDHVRSGAANREERFHHRAVEIEPATLSG